MLTAITTPDLPVQTIKLSGDETISVIRNLLERAGDGQVLLFVPKGCEALERDLVNLTLLRRWADNLTLRLGLVIEDRATQVLAKHVGFVVLPSVEHGQRSSLSALERRRRRRKGLPARPTPSLAFRTSGQPEMRKPLAKALVGARVGVLIAAAAFITLLATLLLFVLPSATVTLQPESEPVEASLEMLGIAGLGEANYGQAQVPARSVYVELESFDTIATSNKRDVPDGHAQGTVVLVNKTSIPVTVTKGTVMRTSFGENVRFYTVADAWVPGELYATARVGIIAAQPGPASNVAALTINVLEGELAAQVDVLNDSRTAGGTVRRVSIVDGVDKVNLRAKLSKSIQEDAYRELTSALERGDFIPPDSLVINVLEEAFDHKVDDVTDQLGLAMRVKVGGLAVSGADGEKLLLGLLEQRMKPGYRLLPASATFERQGVVSAAPEEALFRMSVRAAIAPAVKEEAVRAAIAGKTVEAAKAFLSSQYKLAAEPRIELTGSPLQRLPWWTARIRVRETAR